MNASTDEDWQKHSCPVTLRWEESNPEKCQALNASLILGPRAEPRYKGSRQTRWWRADEDGLWGYLFWLQTVIMLEIHNANLDLKFEPLGRQESKTWNHALYSLHSQTVEISSVFVDLLKMRLLHILPIKICLGKMKKQKHSVIYVLKKAEVSSVHWTHWVHWIIHRGVRITAQGRVFLFACGCFAGSFHPCECSVTYTPSFTHKPTHIAIWPGEGTFSESLLAWELDIEGRGRSSWALSGLTFHSRWDWLTSPSRRPRGALCTHPCPPPGGSFLPGLQLVHKGETGRPCLDFFFPHWGLGTPGSDLKQSTDAPAFASPLQGPLSYITSQPLFVYSLPRVSVEAGESKPVPVTPSWPRAELPVLV